MSVARVWINTGRYQRTCDVPMSQRRYRSEVACRIRLTVPEEGEVRYQRSTFWRDDEYIYRRTLYQSTIFRTDGENWERCIQCVDCDTITPDYYGSVCESCYEDNYFTCESCDEILHNDHYGEDGRCESCNESDEEESSVITRYGKLPSGGWREYRHGGKGSQTLCGIELEVECTRNREDCAERVAGVLGSYALLSEDGSLDDGFEIRTHPATLTYHQTRGIGKLFVRKTDVLRYCRSHDTSSCGLHVHVERQALKTPSAERRLAYFIHNRANDELLYRIARRTDASYSAACERKGKKGCRDYRNMSRYERLNWTSRTVEFRLFKGTLKATSFFACVEFAVASVEYANELRGVKAHGTSADFLQWLRETKDFYTLKEFLQCV